MVSKNCQLDHFTLNMMSQSHNNPSVYVLLLSKAASHVFTQKTVIYVSLNTKPQQFTSQENKKSLVVCLPQY